MGAFHSMVSHICVFATHLSQQSLQTLDLILAGGQLAAGQLKERGAQLQQQHVRQSVLVHEQNAFDGAPHADPLEFVAHALETGRHRGILLEQRILGAECVVGQRVPEEQRGGAWGLAQHSIID